MTRTDSTTTNLGLIGSKFLKLDQSTPQTTVGTFTFPIVHTPTINGGILANDDITIQGTTNATRTSSYVILQPSGGKVGIGTTSPLARLGVIGADSLNTSFAGNISGATGTGLVVTNAGNVGIGTTAPTSKLSVLASGSIITPAAATVGLFQRSTSTAANANISIISGNAATNSGINIGDTDSETVAGIQYNHATNFMSLLTNGSVKATIDNNGNVGIGTTAPKTTLDVIGNVMATSDADNYMSMASSGLYMVSGGILTMVMYDDGYINWETANGRSLNFISTDDIYFNGGDLLTIKNSGNVGIGTTSPTEKTHIVGNLFIDTDSNKLLLGAGKDMSVYYDGTLANIKTNEVAASDLKVTTGASKTITLGNIAKLSMRPTLVASKIVKTGEDYFMVPTQIDRGSSSGYSLPIYASNDEELFFNEYIAGRWDGASDITVSVIGYLSAGEDVGDDFALQLSWANKSTSAGVFPSATTDVEVRTNIDTDRNAQYSIYKVEFTVDWDVNNPDILASDIFCGRLRRIAVGGGYTEITGEFVVQAIIISYSVDKVFKRA